MISLSNVFKCENVVVEKPSELSCVSVPIAKISAKEKEKPGPPEEAEPDAEEITERIAAKRKEADKVLSDARKTADKIFKAAYEKGLAQGRAEGEAEALQKEQAGVMELQKLCERLEAQKGKQEADVQNGALDFAFSLAEKIVCTEIDRDNSVYLNILKDAVSHIADPENVVIKVGSRGYSIANNYITEIRDSIKGLKHLKIEINEKEPDCCRIETEAGMIDAGVKARFLKAEQLLEIKR